MRALAAAQWRRRATSRRWQQTADRGRTLYQARELSARLDVASTLQILCGVVFALYAVLELGRSFSVMPEARRLVTNGPYSVIRHPVYLGEAVALAGVTSQYLSPWALLLLALQFIFQLERMACCHAPFRSIGTTRRARLGSCRDCIEPPDEPLNCTALKSIQIWISAPYIIGSRVIMAHRESESDTLRLDFDRRLKPGTGAGV